MRSFVNLIKSFFQEYFEDTYPIEKLQTNDDPLKPIKLRSIYYNKLDNYNMELLSVIYPFVIERNRIKSEEAAYASSEFISSKRNLNFLNLES